MIKADMKKIGGEGSDGIAYIGSLIGFIAFIKAIIPEQSWDFLKSLFLRFMSWSSSKTQIEVHQFVNYETNELYKVIDLHVGFLTRSKSVERLELVKLKSRGQPSYSLANDEKVEDSFQGQSFTWIHHSSLQKGENNHRSEMLRSYTLVIEKSLRNTLLPDYLEHITRHAKDLKHKSKKRMLYTNYGSAYHGETWKRTSFDHPATLDSIAMDPELKEKIKKDLVAFMGGEKYFRRIGRAWKRGYLLYGPPGTGKTSLIAAIAHFTDYNIYDLELTSVKSNSELREYLSTISSKSIVVIEDIDCSLELKKRGKPAPETNQESGEEPLFTESAEVEKAQDEKSRVTLSGLLNFTDGLWSSTGSERIIIFTTNHIDQLDPALIRTGRMDMHIFMSYCRFPAFRVLARTHLDVEEHELFPRIEELLGEIEITPSDIAEALIQHRENADGALENLIQELENRRTCKNS